MADTEFIGINKIITELKVDYRDILAGITDPVVSPRITKTNEFSDGTGINQAQIFFQQRTTITSGSPTADFDLRDDTMKDPLGRTLVFSAIKALMVISLSTNLVDVKFGKAAADPWEAWTADANATILIPVNGQIVLVNPTAAGWTVAALADRIRFTNTTASSDSVIFDWYLIGEGVAT